MQLFGSIHGGETQFGGFRLVKWQVDPAPEIFEDIKALPKGSRVAIEAIREFHEDGDTMGLSIEDEDLWYWEEVITEAKLWGHNISYLDDLPIHATAAERLNNLRAIRGVLSGLSNFEAVSGREREIDELEFALEATWSHIFEIEREDAIIEVLKKEQPDLAIIGLAHADYIMLTPDLPDELGVTRYARAVVPEVSRNFGSFMEHAFMRQIIGSPDPDNKVLSEREVTIRRYLAATRARITPGQEPQWIGSWRPKCRPSGLFEVHIEERDGEKTSGRIEDELGTASFLGELGKTSLRLVKTYDSSKVLTPNYVEGEIIHEAEADGNGLFTGVWYSDDDPTINGEIVMKEGSSLFEPPRINQ